MRRLQVFLPAALYCTAIMHPDPRHQLANQKALPVSHVNSEYALKFVHICISSAQFYKLELWLS